MSPTKSSDFFCKLMCALALRREGSGRVWRQEEVPALPPEPSPTHPIRCCQHTIVYKKKSHQILFGSSLMDITVLLLIYGFTLFPTLCPLVFFFTRFKTQKLYLFMRMTLMGTRIESCMVILATFHHSANLTYSG